MAWEHGVVSHKLIHRALFMLCRKERREGGREADCCFELIKALLHEGLVIRLPP